jgi:hypothetical protein
MMGSNYMSKVCYVIKVLYEENVEGERRLQVCGKRVLRRLFGPKKDEVTGEWRKLCNELNDLYSSPNIVQVIKLRRMRWAGHVARKGERRGIYRILVGKPLGKETTWKTQV